jgi:hypothetical protein
MRLSFQPQCGLVAVPREDNAARFSAVTANSTRKYL